MTFYINTVTHEVHDVFCDYISYKNIVLLGVYNSVFDAIKDAKNKGYSNADGCAYCCREAHTK